MDFADAFLLTYVVVASLVVLAAIVIGFIYIPIAMLIIFGVVGAMFGVAGIIYWVSNR